MQILLLIKHAINRRISFLHKKTAILRVSSIKEKTQQLISVYTNKNEIVANQLRCGGGVRWSRSIEAFFKLSSGYFLIIILANMLPLLS